MASAPIGHSINSTNGSLNCDSAVFKIRILELTISGPIPSPFKTPIRYDICIAPFVFILSKNDEVGIFSS